MVMWGVLFGNRCTLGRITLGIVLILIGVIHESPSHLHVAKDSHQTNGAWVPLKKLFNVYGDSFRVSQL